MIMRLFAYFTLGLLLAWPATGQVVKQYGVDSYSKLGFRQNGIREPLASSAAAAAPLAGAVLTTFTSSNTVLTAFTTASVSPAANALVLCFVFGGPPVTSVTGNGLTWELVYDGYTPQSAVSPDGLTVYRAMGAAPSAGGITVNMSGVVSAAGIIIQVQQYTGVNTSGANGSGAIGQVFGNYLAATTIAPLNANGLNAIVGAAVAKVNPTAAVLESGWTQDLNQAQTPVALPLGAFIAHRLATTDNSFDSGMAAVTFSLAMEIVAAASVQTFITPTDIAGLQVWSRASDGVFQDAAKAVPCTQGTSVYTWTNKGNGTVSSDFINATALTRPVWHQSTGPGDYDRIICTGTERLSNPMTGLVSASQPFTLIFIGTYTGGSSSDAPLIWNETAAVQLGVIVSGAHPRAYAGTSVASAQAFSVGIVVGGYNSNVGDYIYVNNRNTGTSTTFGVAQFSNSGLIGENLGFGLIGSYYEVMIFSDVLTTAQVCQIQNYAKNRYGFTSY